jgi:biotin carboxyl carrier protein
MQLTYCLGDEQVVLHVEPSPSGILVRLPGGVRREVRARREGALIEIALPSDGDGEVRVVHMFCARTQRGVEISYDGCVYVFTAPSAGKPGASRKRSSGLLAAPMSGAVAEVRVREGERVEAYQTLAIVEAMKVMAPLDAPFAGVVKRVFARAGQQVEHGAPVVEVVSDEQEEGRAP